MKINRYLRSIYQLTKSMFFPNENTAFSLGKNVCVDSSTVILQNSYIRFDVSHENRHYVKIGKFGIIGAAFIFESSNGNIEIGNNVQLGFVTFISRSSIIIEDDVTMAWGITLYDHNSHSIHWDERKDDNIKGYQDYFNYNKNMVVSKNWSVVHTSPIRICSKAWIGFDVTILKGVTIGEGAVVGAKSVVTKDVPPWTVVAGNPARVVKHINKSDE